MSEDWAKRQRNTNRLTRILAKHIFKQPKVNALQLFGLSKLSWITRSNEGDDASYIKSTKIPALGCILNKDYSSFSLEQVSLDVSLTIGDNSAKKLVTNHTGFTNFYNAYRNSVGLWIKDNYSILLPLYKKAFINENNSERKKLVDAISSLPGIPKGNNSHQLMKPEFFLTPVFFTLDPDIKFPIINGNEWVKKLLINLDVEDSDLTTQYLSMTRLYGHGGILDAADLDQVGRDLSDFLTTNKMVAKKKLLEEKETSENDNLPIKDEEDIESIRKAGTIKQRRIHNQLTNKLRTELSRFTLLEGKNPSCMFDVLVRDYVPTGEDLLIEVKSSIDSPNIRMAVGQLYDYWYKLKGNEKPHLAVLLPERPADSTVKFLQWRGIGLMWFDGARLCVANKWLEHILIKSK